MNWLNIEMRVLRAPEYIGSEPIQRATWLQLLAYCAEQENSGVIRDCSTWKDRRWQQTCGVTLQEVSESCDLWTWKNGNLLVWSYPHNKQTEVQAKRQAGAKGGHKSGKKRSKEAELEAPSEAQLEAELKGELEAPSEAQLEGELERKGKEEKGRERNGMEAEEEAAAATTDPDKTSDKITADTLVGAYPRRSHLADALREAAAAMKRHDPALILAGTRAIAAVVATWTESERQQYLKKPPEFFAGDHWADDPAYWVSRRARQSLATPPLPDLGGRKPSLEITI